MSERHEFIDKMQGMLDELQVKASLAKLELGDVKNHLIDDYDHLHDKLRDMRDDSTAEWADEWAAVKGGFLSSWEAFKDKFHAATKE